MLGDFFEVLDLFVGKFMCLIGWDKGVYFGLGFGGVEFLVIFNFKFDFVE